MLSCLEDEKRSLSALFLYSRFLFLSWGGDFPVVNMRDTQIPFRTPRWALLLAGSIATENIPETGHRQAAVLSSRNKGLIVLGVGRRHLVGDLSGLGAHLLTDFVSLLNISYMRPLSFIMSVSKTSVKDFRRFSRLGCNYTLRTSPLFGGARLRPSLSM